MKPMLVLFVTMLGLSACQSDQSPAVPARTGTAAASSSGPATETRRQVTLAPQINARDFAYFDKTLASDDFQGRKPGTVGADRTKAWLVEQFRRMGLEPGNHGSWFQTVPAVSTDLVNTKVKLQVHVRGKSLDFDNHSDMIVGTLQARPDVTLKRSDIVFLGYGIDAPAYDWNDYKGVDVKGKTVILLVNDPGYATQDPTLFKGRTMTYYGRWTYKYEEAARMGAAACFVVHTSDGAAGYPWSVVNNSWSGPQLSLPVRVDPSPRLAVAGWLTHDSAKRLFSAAGLDFDKLASAASRRGFRPVNLKATASIELRSKVGHFQSQNILAMVKGARHPEQTVIYTAHWDHLGMDPSLKGHKVYSGAIDNGTGLSMLLEIANTFAHQKSPPGRTVLFFMPTLEESGLLGSQYYVAHPVFPLDKTVADLAVDALPIIGRARDMTVIGKGQSQLEDMLAKVLKRQGRVESPEVTPQNGFYFRSDHFNFAKAGIPALLVSSGLDLRDGGRARGEKLAADYTRNRYHTPRDVFNPHWDFSGILEDTQAYYELGRNLADSDVFPQWYENSPFRHARAKLTDSSKQQGN